MKAVDVSGQAPGGERMPLAERLPLSTPVLIQFFPIYACNFRCSYCTFSADKSQRDFISEVVRMDFDLYQKCIDDIAGFPEKVKVIRFVGMGEPLMHTKIADMIAYAKQKQVAERIEILTNASLLTPALSDKLIAAGLDRLIVSLQGTSGKKYKDVCDTDIDFEQFVDNLRYFHEHKGNALTHIKIIDLALENDEDKAYFYTLFGDICDTIGIELAGPIFPNVDYQAVLKNNGPYLTQFGRDITEAHFCPQPFFTMQINPDGNVVPCYSVTYPVILGNAKTENLVALWNGKRYNQFRRKMLDGIDQASETCRKCNIVRHRFQPEDRLDDHVPRLQRLLDQELEKHR